MVLEVIYVTRHGFRGYWSVDRDTGEYSTTIPSPTGIPSDPALAGYGVQQSLQLADHLVTLDPPIERYYSSPVYRCIQTLNPTLDKLQEIHPEKPEQMIFGDDGLGEWFGTAPFKHPSPAKPELMNQLWPRYDLDYKPSIIPSITGETIDDLHDRTAYALHRIIEKCDADGLKAIILCTHAATIYAVGRSLTGRMPEDVSENDFNNFTCGLSKFVRRRNGTVPQEVKQWEGVGKPIPEVGWRNGNGVAGGWNCVLNGDCSFLSGGEERGWIFSGDESFLPPVEDGESPLDVESGLGLVIEGKHRKPTGPDISASGLSKLPSRL